MASVTFDGATCLFRGRIRPRWDSLPSGDRRRWSSWCSSVRRVRQVDVAADVGRTRRRFERRILIGDNDVTGLDPKDRDIAMVFQNYALYPHVSVADNMGFPLKMAGMAKPDIQQKVATVAEMLDLTPYLGRKPKALSGGQRQRWRWAARSLREP